MSTAVKVNFSELTVAQLKALCITLGCGRTGDKDKLKSNIVHAVEQLGKKSIEALYNYASFSGAIRSVCLHAYIPTPASELKVGMSIYNGRHTDSVAYVSNIQEADTKAYEYEMMGDFNDARLPVFVRYSLNNTRKRYTRNYTVNVSAYHLLHLYEQSLIENGTVSTPLFPIKAK